MKIFLDAGHNYSGYNTGATGNGLHEQDVTWEIATKCGEILTKNGFETKLSRPNIKDNLGIDNSTSLSVRCKMANDWGADYFVSIHCNAGGGTGTETYCYKFGTTAEKLATSVNNAIVYKLGIKSRGVKTANFYVLLNTKMPAILVETAFIDNTADSVLLKNNTQDFAQAIADGILKFTNFEVAPPPPAPPSGNITTPGDALKKLSDKGIINTPEYWSKAIDTVKNLDELIIKIANKI